MSTIPSSDKASAAITGRSILVGAALSLAIAIGIPYGSMVIQGSRLGLSSATPAAFFLLFVLLLTVQVALGRWGFRRGELVVIFAMMAVATAIPTRGVVGMLLPMITGTFYYATPENQWADLVHPFLSDWMVVYDPVAVKAFYEGTKGSAIPYDVWLKPLGRWFAFYAAFYATIIAAISILRRQWVDNERLVFPLAQVPLAMIQDDGEQKSLKPFFRNPIMWCGLLLPFLFNSTNALHHYFNFVPSLALQTSVELFSRTASLNIRINFLMFGFAYFINSNIAFSLWFFYLLHVIQESIFRYIGIFSPEELGPWTGSGPVGAIMGHQMMGALIVLVFYGLWTARPHLKNVLRKALWGDDRIDDSAEILSYRAAFWLFVGGTSVMGFWLWKSGIPAWIVPFFLFSSLVIFIGLARVIAEAGMPTVTPEMVPAGFVVSGVGVPALGAPGMVATGYSFVWTGDLLVFMTAPLANSLRLGSMITGTRRPLFWAIVAAMLISLVVSCWFMLYLAYRDGAINLHPQYFTGFARYPSDFAAKKLANPTGAEPRRVAVDGFWRPDHGRLNDRPPLLRVVALSPARLCREHWLGNEQHLVFDLLSLAHQDHRPQIRRSPYVPPHSPLFRRSRARPVRRRRPVADDRWLYRHGRQPNTCILEGKNLCVLCTLSLSLSPSRPARRKRMRLWRASMKCPSQERACGPLSKSCP